MTDESPRGDEENRLHLAAPADVSSSQETPLGWPPEGVRPRAGVRVRAPAGAGVFACFVDGARRVARAPGVLGGVWVVNLLLAVPFALAVRGALEAHFGDSVVARDAAQGFSLDWWGEFAARADGLAATFSASVIGFAAVLRNLSDLADARAPIAPLAGAIGLWLLAWTFLWGGILDRYARPRATRAAGFFGACGAHAGRMLRLGLLAGIAYAVLMWYVHPLLFESLYGWMTHDLAVERTAFLIRLSLYLLFGALLLIVHIVTDLARVRAVIEDRRSMIGAYLAGWRLLAARPGAVLGVYGLAAVALVIWLALYALVAPGARGSGAWVWVAFLAGQVYLAGRLWLKLQVPASLIALYRGAVARGDLDLTPSPVWPESPAAPGSPDV
jgi:hypothetical protein